jgi:hypothetical protein
LNQVLHGGLELAARMTLDSELGGRVRRLAKSFVGRITQKELDAAGFAEAWNLLDRVVYKNWNVLVFSQDTQFHG